MRYFILLAIVASISVGQSIVQAEDKQTLNDREKKLIDEYIDKRLKEQHTNTNNTKLSLNNIPGQFNFSGFILSEWEDSDNLGSDGSRINTTAFDSSDKTDRITEGNTFGNLGLDWTLDSTTAHLVLEFGEYAAGLTNSSGQLGADTTDIEVKNFYIDHDFGNGWEISAGIQGIVADPLGFIMDDDQTAFTTTYTINEQHKLWAYVAETHTGTSRRQTDDQSFFGINAEVARENTTWTPFWIHLKDRSTSNQDKVIDFYGFHTLWKHGDWEIESEYIYNSGRTLETGNGSNKSTSLRGQLADIKIKRNIEDSFLSSLSAEWIHTSGGRGKTASGTSNGSQHHFQSQDPQVGYRLNIADSDGSDLAPGTSRLAPINLALAEGINTIIVEAQWQASTKLSGYIRQAWLRTDVSNPITGTGVKNIGRESDAGLQYLLNDYLKFKMDYGYLKTGAYFSPHSDAHLFTSALLLEF